MGVIEQSNTQHGGWEAEAGKVCNSWLSELHLSTQGPQPAECATNNRNRSSPTRSVSGNLQRHLRMCFFSLLAISQSTKFTTMIIYHRNTLYKLGLDILEVL